MRCTKEPGHRPGLAAAWVRSVAGLGPRPRGLNLWSAPCVTDRSSHGCEAQRAVDGGDFEEGCVFVVQAAAASAGRASALGTNGMQTASVRRARMETVSRAKLQAKKTCRISIAGTSIQRRWL